MKNFNACGLIPSIRRGYQILFYISTVLLVIFLLRLPDGTDLMYYIILFVAWACSYAVLLVLRALEFLIGKVFCLEQELANKGIIQRQEQQNSGN